MTKTKEVIWLVNFHARPPHLETFLKTIKFAEYLEEAGYDVYIFSSNNIHNKNGQLNLSKSAIYEFKRYDSLKFVHIKTINYKLSSFLRILSFLEFSIKLFYIKSKFKKPKTIVHTSYLPFDALIYYISKILKSNYIVDILDLWPESFVNVGLIKANNPFVKLAYKIEKWIYKKSDAVIFAMEGGKQYIIDKNWDTRGDRKQIDLSKIYWISNGVDFSDFTKNINNFYDDIHLNDNTLFKVIYIGSIRLANDLKNLVDAANILKNFKKIIFLIYGDGNDRAYLEEYCFKNNISNVIFKEKWVNPNYVPYILSKSSLNILNYKKGLGKYGGSQSKLFQYIASGKPICSNINMDYCIIEKFKLGISKDFANEIEYSQAILSLYNLNHEEIDRIRDDCNALIQLYDYKYLTNKLINIFNTLDKKC